MLPNIPCSNFDSSSVFRIIDEFKNVIDDTQWIQKWFIPYYHNFRLQYPENFNTISVEFLEQSVDDTRKFIDKLPQANNYFWATFFWICGAQTTFDIYNTFSSNIVESIISYNPVVTSGCLQTVRLYVFYCRRMYV